MKKFHDLGQMDYRIPGLVSIFLAFIAIGIADFQLFQYSITIGVVYIVLMPIIFLNTLYQYCRKCIHVADGTCRHVIFGKLINKLFKVSKPSPYTFKEVSSVLISNTLFFIFPQYWLFKNLLLLITFWVFMLISIITIRYLVCPNCCNRNCYFCKR